MATFSDNVVLIQNRIDRSCWKAFRKGEVIGLVTGNRGIWFGVIGDKRETFLGSDGKERAREWIADQYEAAHG